MRTFGRGVLYSIIVIAVLLLISFVIGDTVTLPWFIFIPLFVLVWALAVYQEGRNRSGQG
ncbi:hypothetical protein R70723_15445 [Paenibacillus sp. FSL R7-0273]|uniref:hypothetical protein n=1 Tax=Paenibacillus sp. FSL R7-0273 TaxID=1536772 RepID=UPI0004F591E8|nr:hypothetical protein [Paenibacillus sp. FSL R7-0273]AIQ47123.1 hypothetical protein R70723_15445 [Paenibacillus sp. FSL R7-0273]OMF97123.1 hypothetical protein BK144_00200 [Paenibacillus sp. FSL R7-0273]